MRSAVLIFNPEAGRGTAPAHIDRLGRALRASGFDAEALPTTGAGAATALARDAAAAGAEVVFAFGGDGTLRETAAGLLGSDCALGFIPGGTINVMTLTFGLPSTPLAAAEALGHATVRDYDVGLCNDEPFLMQTSAGVDAELVRRLSTPLKRLVARAAVVPAGLGAFAFYTYPEIRLTADGEPLEGSLVVVSNIPFYGGPFQIQPEARPDDRRLDLVVFRGKGRSAVAGFARDLLFKRHLKRADVVTRAVDEVRIEGPEGLPVQIDGDSLADRLPARIRLSPKRIRVLMV